VVDKWSLFYFNILVRVSVSYSGVFLCFLFTTKCLVAPGAGESFGCIFVFGRGMAKKAAPLFVRFVADFACVVLWRCLLSESSWSLGVLIKSYVVEHNETRTRKRIKYWCRFLPMLMHKWVLCLIGENNFNPVPIPLYSTLVTFEFLILKSNSFP
jgi:hypothetical protein